MEYLRGAVRVHSVEIVVKEAEWKGIGNRPVVERGVGLPVDHVMFGSDFPHPEGMADPLAYYDIVKDLPMDQQKMIMGGSIEKALKVGTYAT